MELKPGYKQTEVGVIPEEWEVKPLGELGKWKGGMTPSMQNPDFWLNGTVPWISSGDVKSVQLKETGYYITHEAIKQGTTTMLPAGSIVLVTRSGILRKYLPVATNIVPMAINQDIKALIPEEEVSSSFILHMLTERGPRILSRCMKAGTTVESVEFKWLKAFALAIPPLPEQCAIAEALSDVDGLLGGLDRLIAKKRDLKQAAMQQLLTGQTRLPGFHGEWEVKRLKQVAEISTGINKPLSEMGSGALYVTVQDLYDKTSIRTERLSRIKVSPNEIETRGLMVGDIVFGKSSVKRDGIGYPSQFLGCGEPVVFSGFTYRARARQGVTDATFLFYALREEKTRRWLIDNSQASALTNINQTIADAIPVQVPPSVPEQTAIAEVLSEMDGELAVLEQRREKTRALKQAMMQELLTGRTRLI
jgi:type I restriction enzyme S subunit